MEACIEQSAQMEMYACTAHGEVSPLSLLCLLKADTRWHCRYAVTLKSPLLSSSTLSHHRFYLTHFFLRGGRHRIGNFHIFFFAERKLEGDMVALRVALFSNSCVCFSLCNDSARCQDCCLCTFPWVRRGESFPLRVSADVHNTVGCRSPL